MNEYLSPVFLDVDPPGRRKTKHSVLCLIKLGVVGFGTDTDAEIAELEKYLQDNNIEYGISATKRMIWVPTLQPGIIEEITKERPKKLEPVKVAP